MDNHMLVSLMGSSQATTESSKASRKPESKDSESFSKAMQEAGGQGQGNSLEEDLMAEQDAAKLEVEERRSENRPQSKPTYAKLDKPAPGSREYIHDQMYKNPDTMTMAEKRALNLPTNNDSNRLNATEMAEMRAMAAERNINLRDLTAMQLNNADKSVKAENEVNAKEFAKALGEKEGKDGKGAKEAGGAAASEKSEGKVIDKSLADAVMRHAEDAKNAQANSPLKRRQQVVNQIVEHMEMRNLANRDELHLKLNPEYLGELKIKLTKGENGEISAQFLTTSDETREVLRDSRSELRTRVESTGLKLGTISIAKVDDLETGIF